MMPHFGNLTFRIVKRYLTLLIVAIVFLIVLNMVLSFGKQSYAKHHNSRYFMGHLSNGAVDEIVTKGAIDRRFTSGAINKRVTNGAIDKRAINGAIDKRVTNYAIDKRIMNDAIDKRIMNDVIDKIVTSGAIDKRTTKGAIDRKVTNRTTNKRVLATKVVNAIEVDTDTIAKKGFFLFNKTKCFMDGRMNVEYANNLSGIHNVNVCVSDTVDLNRDVPDSRPLGCKSLTFGENLLSTSVIVTFYDEWPSVLLRTIHSIINRTPSKWMHEIVLVDDASTLESLKGDLDAYLDLFPRGLIKMVQLAERRGLIHARLAGIAESTGEVVVIFDSHMEVNHNWLEPLLSELVKDRKTFVMATLDYIESSTFEYLFFSPIPRYGFDWALYFYENIFWRNQTMRDNHVRPGVVGCGSGFAVRRDYFYEIGAYDDKMNIWGGENLELSWRVWLCGGRMVHALCSSIGHIARGQPYSFPGGREEVTRYNYKRAVEVWMEPNHKELVYSNFPGIEDIDAGDLTERLELKSRLKCKPFSWFINNVWPDLGVLNENTTAWGRARNILKDQCLDTKGEYAFHRREVEVTPCAPFNTNQGFSITETGLLRTQLHCVQFTNREQEADKGPYLGDCLSGTQDIWEHEKESLLKHQMSGLCLEVKDNRALMRECNASSLSQQWDFDHYTL